MKKLIALFTLLPVLTWAFPVYTNRLDFDPAESTGQFDDFLWRWSGFDDQKVDLFFSGVSASNVGFRLAYPQRGKVFLDVLPPSVVGVTTTIVTEVLDVYTTRYPRITYTVETNAFTNTLIRSIVVDGSFVRAETTTVSRAQTKNTVTAFEPAAIVYTQSAPQQLTAEYGTVTNQVVGATNYLVKQTIRRITTNSFRKGRAVDVFTFTPPQDATMTNYNITPPAPLSAEEISYGIGLFAVSNISVGTEIVTNNPEVSFSKTISFGEMVDGVQLDVYGGKDGQTNFTYTFIAVVPQVVGGTISTTQTISYVLGGGDLVITSVPALLNENISFLPYSRNIQSNYVGSVLYFNTPTNQITLHVKRNPFSGNGFRDGQNNITNFSLSYDIRVEGFKNTTNTIETEALDVSSNVIAGASTVVVNYPAELRNSAIYSRTEETVSYLTFDIPRTNMPPDGPYFAEVLTYSGSDPTNATQSRTLAKGQVTVENSIWSVTNYAGYTNYPGPWDYLLQDGSRPMENNFDAGGYGVTNIGSPYIGFEDGTYISPSNVALWNSFIQGTAVALTVSTEFDGNVTGVWNNLTLRKNVLDEMQFLDLTTTPTGTPSVGRMVWDADRETIQFGLDENVSLDIGQQQVALVKNAESVTISNGMVVYLNGASGDKATVKIASYSNDFLSARTMGIAAENIGPNEVGYIVTRGPVYNQNTAAFTEGAVLYLGAYGNLTTNRPAAPLHGVFIGVAEKINANAGVIYVAIQNGFELDELHDVNIAVPATNDLLIYNGTVWTNYARTNLSGIYLPLAGGTMNGNLDMNENDIVNVTQVGPFSGGSFLMSFETGQFDGEWNFTQQPIIPGYLTSTGAAATYVQITNLPAGIVTTNNLSTIAGSGLGVTNNQLVVTNAPIDLSAYKTNSADWSLFPATTNIAMSTNEIKEIESIGFAFISDTNYLPGIGSIWVDSTATPMFQNSRSGFQPFYGGWNFSASSYLTISAGNTNYARRTTVPASNTAFGSYNQWALDNTNLYFYNAASSKWLKVNGTLEW